MPLNESEDQVTSERWAGGEVLVLHGGLESCWIQASDSDSFVDLEDWE